MQFEWDPDKDQVNQRKHGLSFSEATELFCEGNDYLEIYDGEHSNDEDRFIAIGLIQAGVVVVVFTERSDDAIRIVSARRATRKETRLLQEYLEDRHA